MTRLLFSVMTDRARYQTYARSDVCIPGESRIYTAASDSLHFLRRLRLPLATP
jgi:hypothetical protein